MAAYPDFSKEEFTLLVEPELSNELARLAHPQSQRISGITVDSVTLQPCPTEAQRSQDRLFAVESEFGLLLGIFDGHAGHETADYAVVNLPPAVFTAIHSLPSSNPSSISSALSNTLTAFDHSIGAAVISLVPDPASVSDEDIRSLVNDDGPNQQALLRAMRGTTALLALIDRDRKNLWTANLGDCRAILGVKRDGLWTATQLTEDHNGSNAAEVQKMKDQHPGEQECMLDNRVLGVIAVTRALGDHITKFPSIYTTKVLLNSAVPFGRNTGTPLKVVSRVHSPPYILSTPDVIHTTIPKSDKCFLLLCSDGLPALYAPDEVPTMTDDELANEWVRIVGAQLDGDEAAESVNLALSVLRSALGGDDLEKVSRSLTVKMTTRWMDDTTIQVVRLSNK